MIGPTLALRHARRLDTMTTSAPLRVGVTGARGRMGDAVVENVLAAPGMELAAAIDIGDSLDELVAQSCDVVIDFTTPDAVMGNLEFAIGAGMHCVVGTTGFDDDRLSRVKEWTAGHPNVGVLIAPNFSIGAVVMMHLSALAARYFESVEIVELHHPDKVDAPSGTAAHTAAAIAHARADLPPAPDATASQLDGARGARVEASPCIRCECVVSSRTRRSCSAGRERRCPFDTTPSTVVASCRA